MPMQTLAKANKKYLFILIFFIGIFIYFAYDRYDTSVRCKPFGYAQDEAEQHAFKKLEFQNKRHNFSNMHLVNKKFDESEHLWIFEYQDNNKCNISIGVDSCGSTDVGGMSHECIALENKK